MRLHVAIAMKDAVEHDIRTLFRRTHGDVEDIVAGCTASIEENLRSIRGEVCRLGRTLYRNALRDIHPLDSDAPRVFADANRLRRIENAQVANPAIYRA